MTGVFLSFKRCAVGRHEYQKSVKLTDGQLDKVTARQSSQEIYKQNLHRLHGGGPHCALDAIEQATGQRNLLFYWSHVTS